MTKDRVALVAAVIAMLLTGCSEPVVDGSTIQTAAPSTTTSSSPATTTTLVAQPQTLRGSALEPGDYVTTAFEPTVQFRLEQQYPLIAFQTQVDAGLQNKTIFSPRVVGVANYKGVAIHNWWLRLTPDQIVAEVGEISSIVWEAPSETEFGGFPATVIEGTTSSAAVLWENRQSGGGGKDSSWNLEPDQRLRLIVVDTTAGSLLITVQADTEEWDDFLPVAEEILAGISFPDLD